MFHKKIDLLLKSQKKFAASDSEQAGAFGEDLAYEQLQGMLKGLRCKAKIFRSVRVPKALGGGKYEIDLLLVSQAGILAIEVKHWSGHIFFEQGAWGQQRGSDKKAHPDPIALNQEKLVSLQQWLSARGIEVPARSMRSLVLFSNPKAILSKDIRAMPEASVASTFLAKVQETCSPPKPTFWRKRASLDFPYRKTVAVLEELPTWDTLRLHGGRIIRGDLELMQAPNINSLLLQRRRLRSVSLLISRSVFPGVLLPAKLLLRDWAGKRRLHSLHPDAKLVFRPAGKLETEEFSWIHVESLQLGWKDESYYRKSSDGGAPRLIHSN